MDPALGLMIKKSWSAMRAKIGKRKVLKNVG